MSVARSARKTSSCQYVVTAGEVDSLMEQSLIKGALRHEREKQRLC
jgi:hypothetical protein